MLLRSSQPQRDISMLKTTSESYWIIQNGIPVGRSSDCDDAKKRAMHLKSRYRQSHILVKRETRIEEEIMILNPDKLFTPQTV